MSLKLLNDLFPTINFYFVEFFGTRSKPEIQFLSKNPSVILQILTQLSTHDKDIMIKVDKADGDT